MPLYLCFGHFGNGFVSVNGSFHVTHSKALLRARIFRYDRKDRFPMSTPSTTAPAAKTGSITPRVVIATTAMLSFISFWRAAAIVLNDLASSAFYAGGIAEQAIGKAAPWFILAIMLFAYAVRSMYIESCSMFVRGGVYRVVKEA